ncbi:MAG: phage scaffolding protein [Lachnospiraceae bacterium]|nr:phage scaffolding protein [Lachnospiraceae bacterium]
MKNIFEIMKEYGLEVPEENKKEFEKAVLENYKTVTDYDKQTEKLNKANDTIKANDTAIQDLQKELESFKDADVTALNQRITDLEAEKETIKKEYDDKIADRDFNDMLKESIAAVKGRNAKAITALLDTDALKASKNQKEDVAAALKALTEAEDSKMLFGEPEPNIAGIGSPIGTVTKGGNQDSDAAMRAVMGLPPVTEQK